MSRLRALRHEEQALQGEAVFLAGSLDRASFEHRAQQPRQPAPAPHPQRAPQPATGTTRAHSSAYDMNKQVEQFIVVQVGDRSEERRQRPRGDQLADAALQPPPELVDVERGRLV
jgi:hypothetical protein